MDLGVWVFAIGDEFDIPNGEHRKVTGVGKDADHVLTEGGPFPGALPIYWVRKYATNLRRDK